MISNNKRSHPIRIQFATLGCPKNLVDSEKMIGLILESGMILAGPDDPADVIVINTCGFIDSARQEAYEVIVEAIEDKLDGQVQKVIVAGCLAQLWGQRILDDLPEVDAVIGLGDRENIADIIKTIINDNDEPFVCQKGPWKGAVTNDLARLRLTEPYWAYLRISEGCSQGCAFCTIPKIRGPFRSKSPETILTEARELIADGAVELNLIGQETTGYGIDIGYETGLAGLVRQLNELDGLKWLRILYAHPATLGDDLIDAMSECERVAPYIDLPLQHINDRLLKLMNRHITRAETESLLKTLRQRIDQLTIRTTMLVGFPSETDDEFEELLDFVREQRFDALGGFEYSKEAGTAAAKIKPMVPKWIRQERYDRLMLTQQEIAFELGDALIGKRLPCLFESPLTEMDVADLELPAGGCWYVGRHIGQAAEIDSECYIEVNSLKLIQPGEIHTVALTGRMDYDMIGELR